MYPTNLNLYNPGSPPPPIGLFAFWRQTPNFSPLCSFIGGIFGCFQADFSKLDKLLLFACQIIISMIFEIRHLLSFASGLLLRQTQTKVLIYGVFTKTASQHDLSFLMIPQSQHFWGWTATSTEVWVSNLGRLFPSLESFYSCWYRKNLLGKISIFTDVIKFPPSPEKIDQQSFVLTTPALFSIWRLLSLDHLVTSRWQQSAQINKEKKIGATLSLLRRNSFSVKLVLHFKNHLITKTRKTSNKRDLLKC